jgi:hypothetical protein
MRVTAAALGIACALLTQQVCGATEVCWVDASDLAPQDTWSSLSAGDLDNDGDQDLSFLGVNPVYHYWNVGSGETPVWQLDTAVYGGVAYCEYQAGALGDLDADGDLDVVTTCYSGSVRLHENVGTADEPSWQERPGAFTGIHVYEGGSQPCLADIDADGDLDLIVVAGAIGIMLVENVGTPEIASWVHAGYLAGLDDGPKTSPQGAFGDIDGDGDLDMVQVSWDTPPQCWENVGTPSDCAFIENPAMLTGVEAPARGYGIELVDVDGDTDVDLLICGYMQNFLYLNEQVTPVEPSSWGRIKSLCR